MPNQEPGTNWVFCVIYRDWQEVSELILLPDWELLQAISLRAAPITVNFNGKQKWKVWEFQNGTAAGLGRRTRAQAGVCG